MVDKPTAGKLLGIPYNFEQPGIRRMLSTYWQPGEGMLVEKPFGIGFTLNLANWRSWVVIAVAGVLWWQSTQTSEAEEVEEPVEVLVED